MAVLPAKSPGNAKSHTSGARFRQRKISVKQPLTIYKQRDLPSLDNNDLEPSQVHHLNSNQTTQQRDLHAIETGVDKNEEDEVHLQQVINAAQKALLGSKDKNNKDDQAASVYIPTPDASQIWADAPKYYSDQVFNQPESFIKFSATIEDTVGVEYNMDEDDEKFFNDVLNKTYPKSSSESKCTELEFEAIVDRFEKTIEEKQPFLSMDPSNILTYKELSGFILEEFGSSSSNTPYTQSGTRYNYLSTTALKEKLSKELNWEPFVTVFDKDNKSNKNECRPIPKLFELFGEAIYNHWKQRKMDRRGKSIHPSLKFEDPNANEKDNDNDPYICFRRREFRQARKTRRADTLGAERIRLLQKSLHQARDIILNVAQREILKLQNYEADHSIFKLRAEGKSLKRAVGIKGDDHLFYPHKRKKIIKVKEEEERRDKKLTSRDSSNVAMSGSAAARAQQVAAQEETSSSTQPYVKLPPSKIPDMDLVTVSLVLKEKNETIKRAVLEKLRKRKEQDKGFVNLTDNPYEPYFNITTNNEKYKELSHIPYSSIAAANYHQINTSNYLSDSVKKILEEAKRPLPGVKTLRGSNGELIPSKPFPHLSSLLQDRINKSKSNNYISLLLSNIETHNFNAYSNGFAAQVSEDTDDSALSDPVFRLRKRSGRNNRTFVDRRGLVQRPNDVIDEFLKFDDTEDTTNEDDMDIDTDADKNKSSAIPNVYDSKVDVITRLDSRWKFDTDLSESQKGETDPFCLDPSRLNSISDDTQSIRFGSMLLSKSYGLLRDAVHQKQQLYLQQARLRAIQHSNRQQTQSATSNSSSEKSQLSEQQLLHRQQLQNKANSNTGLKPGSGNGGGSSSSSLTSQQSNGRSSNLAGSPSYNNSRSNKNSSDSKLTNNFNAQNIKHYNKSSTIASPNKASTPVSGSQK